MNGKDTRHSWWARGTSLLAASLLISVSMLASWANSAQTEKGRHDAILFEANHMVPMQDGVRLATDIYRPAKNGTPLEEKLPVLLHRTPYDKAAKSRQAEGEYFASHGYIVAIQDARGRFGSEGVFTKYIGEGRDGRDTIEYLGKLPYADGQVASFGTSYAAHTQANASKLKPEHLATMILNMGGMYNGWNHKIRNGGAFELQQVTWAFRNLASETKDPTIIEMMSVESIRHWLTVLPLRRGLNPLSVAPNFEDYILKMQNQTDYDAYWKHPDINWREHFDKTADVPMVHVTGWYDSYCGGTIENVLGLRKHLSAPVHLIVGPWTHGGNTRSYAGNVEFGSDAAMTDFYRDFHVRWFDEQLKQVRPSKALAPVKIFVMGTGDGHADAEGRLFHGGYWRESSEWPLPDTTMTPYYLHGDGRLSTETPSATSSSPAKTVYTFDPREPVPTIGGSFSSTSPIFEPGAYDQRESDAVFGAEEPFMPLRARNDVLVFQTDSLEEAVEVVGPIRVVLHVSSSVPDTDFTVKLVDVYPPTADFPIGFEMNLTDGILRTRYRESPETQTLMTPETVYELVIEPFPTANVFKAGHRIRLDISSSNFPRFDVNPNTGEPLGLSRRHALADNAVYHSGSRASHVVLPIVPTKSRN